MITIFLFIVFVARLTYLHYSKVKNKRYFVAKDFAAPIIITALFLLPLILTSIVSNEARQLTQREIIEEYHNSPFRSEQLDAYKFVMRENPKDIDLRFQFIDEADEFERLFDYEVDSVLRNFNYSSDTTVQHQSLAYLYASRYSLNANNILPLENAPRTNYINAIRAERSGKHVDAIKLYWKELKVNPNYTDAASRIYYITAREFGDTALNKLIRNEAFVQHFSTSQQRRFHYETGKWHYYLFDIVKATFKKPMFTALFAGLVISILWLIFMRNLDIFRKEKWQDLIIVFLLGGFFTHFCWIGYDIANFSFDFGITGEVLNDFLYCVFVIGLGEEIVKFIPWIAFIFLARKAKEPYDYILYASVSALGFAFVENLRYLENPGNISGRSIMSTVGHMFFASLVAYGFVLSRYRAKTGNMKIVYPILGFIAAILAHGFYDYWLISPAVNNLSIITFIFFAISTTLWLQFINNAMNNSPFYVGRKFEPLRQINTVSIGLVLILAVEFVIINYNYGTEFATRNMVTGSWMVPLFLLYMSAIILEFEVSKGRWRRFQFRLANYIPFLPQSPSAKQENRKFEYASYEGLELRLFVPKSNRFVGSKFPIRVRSVGTITVSNAPDWYLCETLSSFEYAGHRNDYVIIRTKDNQMPLDADKVEIILLFMPSYMSLDNTSIETRDLHFTGKAFSRPLD